MLETTPGVPVSRELLKPLMDVVTLGRVAIYCHLSSLMLAFLDGLPLLASLRGTKVHGMETLQLASHGSFITANCVEIAGHAKGGSSRGSPIVRTALKVQQSSPGLLEL